MQQCVAPLSEAAGTKQGSKEMCFTPGPLLCAPESPTAHSPLLASVLCSSISPSSSAGLEAAEYGLDVAPFTALVTSCRTGEQHWDSLKCREEQRDG